ncbi:MAG: hypothetical protein ABH823_00435 [bacterium]
MNSLFVALIGLSLFALGYHFYAAFILFIGLLLGYLGIFVSLPKMNAPMFISHQSSQGPLWRHAG